MNENKPIQYTTATFMAVIRQRCADEGMTPQQLRRKAGISRLRFWRAWNDKVLYLPDLFRFSLAFNCNPTDLLPDQEGGVR